MSDRRARFDDWADTYDADVAAATSFPFVGYELALARVVDLAKPKAGDRVLDVGIGVGHLAARFADMGCVVTGVDFSSAMLDQAKRRVPSATLLRLDLLDDWSPLTGQRFDIVASGYVLHQFDDVTKLAIVRRLREEHLAHGGRIVIADIAFETQDDIDRARSEVDGWDDSVHYWVVEEMANAIGNVDLRLSFSPTSFCAGVLCIMS